MQAKLLLFFSFDVRFEITLMLIITMVVNDDGNAVRQSEDRVREESRYRINYCLLSRAAKCCSKKRQQQQQR